MLGGGNKAVTPELKGFVQKENVRLPERGSSSSHHRGDRSSSGVFGLTDSSHLAVGSVREGGFKRGQAALIKTSTLSDLRVTGLQFKPGGGRKKWRIPGRAHGERQSFQCQYEQLKKMQKTSPAKALVTPAPPGGRRQKALLEQTKLCC